MNLQMQDTWLPVLVATAFGLGIGLGLSALLKLLWQRGLGAVQRLRLPRYASSAPALLPSARRRSTLPALVPATATATATTTTTTTAPTPAQLTALALSKAQRLKAPAPNLPEAADLLLVDDSAVARAKLRKLFEPAGYSMHFANDGLEALALLKQGHYALMITDLEMPNMDGVALINACLANPQTARMPILAITGHDHLRAKFNECKDICGIHRKPWVDDILLSHVAAIVAQRMSRERQASASVA
jgi:CheY-like chemotaxis protein